MTSTPCAPERSPPSWTNCPCRIGSKCNRWPTSDTARCWNTSGGSATSSILVRETPAGGSVFACRRGIPCPESSPSATAETRGQSGSLQMGHEPPLLLGCFKRQAPMEPVHPAGCRWSLGLPQSRPATFDRLRNDAALPVVRVMVFAPAGSPEAKSTPNPTERPRMTVGQAALIVLTDWYLKGLLDPFVSLLEFPKMLYFLQSAGHLGPDVWFPVPPMVR